MPAIFAYQRGHSLHRPDAAPGGKAQARLKLGERRDVGQRGHAKRRMRRQRDRLPRKLDHRRQILQRIDTHLVDVRVAAHRLGPNEDCVAVGRALGDALDPEIAVGAGFVLHHDLLAERPRQVLGDDAGADIGRAAGRERHDEVDRAGRPVFRRRGERSGEDDDQGSGDNAGIAHRMLLLTFVSRIDYRTNPDRHQSWIVMP